MAERTEGASITSPSAEPRGKGILVERLGPGDHRAGMENCSLFWSMDDGGTALSEFLSAPGSVLLAAEVHGEHAGQIVGYVLPRWDRVNPMLFLYSVDVLPEYRRMGVASALIARFNSLGRSMGCSKSFVLTDSKNLPATALYGSCGGVRVESTDVMYQWDLQALPDHCFG